MIEIKERDDIWECYVDGGLFEYDVDLQVLLHKLHRQSESLIEFMNE